MKILDDCNLESDRLIIRKFTTQDYKEMFLNWASDPLTSKFLDWNAHENEEVTKNIVQCWIDDYDKGIYNWVVQLKNTNQLIGSISVVGQDLGAKSVEIGYCYGSKFWGNGYASEALKCVIKFFFDKTDTLLVEAKHISGNPASGSVMQKAGMKFDASLRLRKLNKFTKQLDDLIVYSITKSEYRK